MHLLVYCIILIFSISFIVKKYNRKYKLISAIVSSEYNLFGIGVAHMFVGDTESIMKSFEKISLETTEKGGLQKVWLGPLPCIVVTDGLIMDTILKNHLEKGYVYKILQSATGNGTLFASESIWKCRRKTITSVLNPRYVTKFFDAFLERSVLLVEKMSPETTDKRKFGIWSYLNSYSFDIIWQVAMGKGLFAMKEDKKYFLDSITIIKNYLSIRCFHFWLHLDMLFRFHPNHSIIETRKKTVYGFLEQTIEKKKRAVDGDIEQYALKQGTRMTFFELLWYFSKREKEYNNLELREELLSLIIAATDTTATTIGFILKLLSKYPSIQDKVYEELCAEFQDQNMLPNSKDDLTKLEYTERVINEALRLYPPAPIIVRKAKKETMLVNGVMLPKNCNVLVSIWGLHRNKNLWGDDADAFDPDRFLPERYSRVPPGSFIPFSSGPRSCPGSGYAMMSIKTSLSVILKTYKIVPDPENGPIPQMKLKFDISLTPVDETVALEKRC